MAKSVEKRTLRKGPWSPEEDHKLIAYINRYGIWKWTEMAKPAGLQRTGKSCRLRWLNYLKPGIKRGNFTREEEETIIDLHERLGNRELLQISILETEQKSSSEIDLPLANGPIASNSESYGSIQLSPQFSTDSLPSSSSNPAAEIDKNQTIGSIGELQSKSEQPFTAEGPYTAENSGAIYAEPEVSAASSQLTSVIGVLALALNGC
ncbi:hypothetical protein CRYUN_Cryun34aG0019700 [Craigia yunnanensis]